MPTDLNTEERASSTGSGEGRGTGRVILLLVSATLIAAGGAGVVHWATTRPSAASTSAPPSASPPAADSAPAGPTSSAGATGTAGTSAASASSTSSPSSASAPAARPGVPVAIDIPVASANHPNGVRATITSHPLNPDGTLFVPADPTEVAWANQDAAPGSSRGTAILVSHVNYVINGRTVAGAFADLAQYARTAIGRRITLRLADGRTMAYRIVSGREYSKDQLAAQPQLRRVLYNQVESFGKGTGRLLLVSCGGNFDPSTGEYEDNVFLYALPV